MTQDLQNTIEDFIIRYRQADDRDFLDHLKQLLSELTLHHNAFKNTKSIARLVAENRQHIIGKTPQEGIIKSGFDDLDKLIGGFCLGEFVVVGGRPAMGKTQLLVNLSLHISQSFPTLYVTLDLSEFLLTCRFISSVTEIPAQDILQYHLNEEQKIKLATIDDAFSKRKLFINDSCNGSIEALKALCQKQILENGIKVIVVDYLQLISSYHHRKYREHEVSHISRELKNMAKENDVCIIASSQLSRAVEGRWGTEGKRPLLSDLRESGAIEQDADKVIFIHRPEYYGINEDSTGNSLTNLAEIIVAKNRNGRLGDFFLARDNDFTHFCTHVFKKDFTFAANRLLEFEEMPF